MQVLLETPQLCLSHQSQQSHQNTTVHAAVRAPSMILRSAMNLSLQLIPLSDNFPLKAQVRPSE